MPINLRLFGSIHIEQDGRAIAVGTRKAEAMLAYLALASQPQSREKLATLLWPGYGQSDSLSHLRGELSRLRKKIGHGYFIADRKEIYNLNPDDWVIDTVRFSQIIDQTSACTQPASQGCTRCLSQLEEAVALYLDDFLAGFTLPDATEFDDWRFFQMEGYRQELADALNRLSQGYAVVGQFSEAIPFARRLVALDPLDEPNQRQLMGLYAQAGQHAAAQRQYEGLVATFNDEFGAPPSPETDKLAESIRTRTFPTTNDQSPPHPLTPSPPHLFISSAPPKPTIPNPSSAFVGREAELAHFGQRLEKNNIAVISGMAGIGKSELALALAHKVAEPERTFWHTFHENEGIESVIWRVAAFLAWHKQDEVWRMLENSQQTGAQLPPLSTLVDYLTQTMKGERYLLCIDDLHHVEDDPAAAEPIFKLTQLVQSGDISVIITSRRMPAFAQWSPENQLHGLTLDDAASMLNARGIELANEYVHQLHENTGGNAQFLNLIIQALRKSRSPQRLINNLLDADDLERYLLNEVNSQLSQDEQAVINACSAMMGYPAARQAIEAMLDGQRIRNPLRSLTDAHLLNFSEGEEEREYYLHAIVGDFYYEGLSRRERDGLHQRAGSYYEAEEPDIFLAALHYERAGEIEKAAQLATDDIQLLISQGRILPIRRLLERLSKEQLSQYQYAAVHGALGQVYALLGEQESALGSYEIARELCKVLPETATLAGKLYLGMASLAEQSSFDEALELIEQGLEELEDNDPTLAAALYIKMAGIWAVKGNMEAGERAIRLASDRLPQEKHTLSIGLLENAGVLSFHQGRFQQAKERWHEALRLCHQLPNPFKAVDLLNNLGASHLIAGQWQDALATLRQGLQEAEQIGTVHHLAMFNLNLGILYVRLGQDSEAEAHLQKVPETQTEYAVNSLYSLAELRIYQGMIDEASQLLADAQARINEAGTRYHLPEIYCLAAKILLIQMEYKSAAQYISKALAVASEMGMRREEGVAHSIDGELNAAQDNLAEAVIAFQRSLELLSEPYESAQTQLKWAQSIVQANPPEALSLAQTAQKTFLQLDAKRDLAEAQQLLSTLGS